MHTLGPGRTPVAGILGPLVPGLLVAVQRNQVHNYPPGRALREQVHMKTPGHSSCLASHIRRGHHHFPGEGSWERTWVPDHMARRLEGVLQSQRTWLYPVGIVTYRRLVHSLCYQKGTLYHQVGTEHGSPAGSLYFVVGGRSASCCPLVSVHGWTREGGHTGHLLTVSLLHGVSAMSGLRSTHCMCRSPRKVL